MNLLAKAKLTLTGGIFPFRSIAVLQQWSLYCTKTAPFSAILSAKNLRAQKPSDSSLPPMPIKERKVSAIDILFKHLVGNTVNLKGRVKTPAHIEYDADGKCLATVLISQDDDGDSGTRLFPVVFEGDLVQLVCRLKENDRVDLSWMVINGPSRFVLNLWRDLLKSPKQWWDYRGHKSNGLVKERHPDFKHKDSGNGLWIDSAPDWVSQRLAKLEFDVKFLRLRQSQGGEGVGGAENRVQGAKGEDSWRNLVENPYKWWDNRLGKKNPRSPDFKHKETGEGLWLSDMPEWALSRLPRFRLPRLKGEGAEAVGETKEFGVKFVTANRVQGAKGDDSWRNLVENPNKWWDNRLGKKNPRSPDFKHKETGEGLWLSDMPKWALSRLPQSKDGIKSTQALESV